VHKVYKSEKGVGAPGRPVNRQDKNVRRWYLSIARHVLYLLDSIHLCEVVARSRRGSPDVVIVDRYIYDQLANLPLKNPFTRVFIRAIHAFVPRPDIAYLLDADVDAACLRKPEYPVEFLRKCRQSYFELARQLKTIEIIPAEALAEARRAYWRPSMRSLPDANGHRNPTGSGLENSRQFLAEIELTSRARASRHSHRQILWVNAGVASGTVVRLQPFSAGLLRAIE